MVLFAEIDRAEDQVESTLVYGPTAGPVARSLIGAKAYLVSSDMANEGTWFTWKSKIRAPVYMDCRQIPRDPGATRIVVNAMGSAIRAFYPDADYVVGLAEAGVIWSSLVAQELGCPHAFVRKSRKEHGTSSLIECAPSAGRNAVLVDDLMASGGSMETAYRALANECETKVLGAMTIVNWNFRHMRERFARIGLPFHSLVSFPNLVSAAFQGGQLSRSAAEEITRFYRNPKQHTWDFAQLRGEASA